MLSDLQTAWQGLTPFEPFLGPASLKQSVCEAYILTKNSRSPEFRPMFRLTFVVDSVTSSTAHFHRGFPAVIFRTTIELCALSSMNLSHFAKFALFSSARGGSTVHN
jgi:hypothetical protein